MDKCDFMSFNLKNKKCYTKHPGIFLALIYEQIWTKTQCKNNHFYLYCQLPFLNQDIAYSFILMKLLSFLQDSNISYS